MDDVRRARIRLATVAGGLLLAVGAALLITHLSQGANREPGVATSRVPVGPHDLATPEDDDTPAEPLPAVWSRPVTRDAADLARAFALAIWTYESAVPYERWIGSIGGWANPLGTPASARVAQSMLPPRPAYDALRAESAHARANVTDVTVPEAASELVSQAPDDWHAYVVRGTQQVSTARGRYQAARQVSVAVVCDPTCWLWSATPEVTG